LWANLYGFSMNWYFRHSHGKGWIHSQSRGNTVLHNHYLTLKKHMVQLNIQLSRAPRSPALRILGSPLWLDISRCRRDCSANRIWIPHQSGEFPVQICILLSKTHHKNCDYNWQKYVWRDWGNDMTLFRLLKEAEQELEWERLKWSPFDWYNHTIITIQGTCSWNQRYFSRREQRIYMDKFEMFAAKINDTWIWLWAWAQITH